MNILYQRFLEDSDFSTEAKHLLENLASDNVSYFNQGKELILDFILKKYYLKFKSKRLAITLLGRMISKGITMKVPSIMTLLTKVKELDLTNEQRALYEHYEYVLEHHILHTSSNIEKKSKFEFALQFEEVYSTLFKMIMGEARHILEYWTEMKNKMVSPTNIQIMAQKVDDSSQQIKQIWKEITSSSYPIGTHFYMLYGLYLIALKDMRKEGEIIIKKADLMKKEDTKINDRNELNFHQTNFISKNSFLMRISGEKHQLGKIQSVSNGISYILGYDAERLVGESVNNIMQASVKEHHDSFIIKYLGSGQNTVFGNNRILYCLDRDNYLVPALVCIKLYPFAHDGVSFISCIRKLESYGDCIVFQKDGIIEGFTKQIADVLKVDRSFTKSNKIFDIFSDFETSLSKELVRLFPEADRHFYLNGKSCLEFLEHMVQKDPSGTKTTLKESRIKVSIITEFTLMDAPQKYKTVLLCELLCDIYGMFRIYTLRVIGYEKFPVLDYRFVTQLQERTQGSPGGLLVLRRGRTEKPKLMTFTEVVRSMQEKARVEKLTKIEAKNEIYHNDTPSIELDEVKDEKEDDESSSTKRTHEADRKPTYLLDREKERERERIMNQKQPAAKVPAEMYERNSVTGSNASSIFQRRKIHMIQKALDESYQPFSVKVLKAGLIMYMLLSVIFMGLLELWNNDMVSEVEANLIIITLAQEREDEIIEVNRRARLINLMERGIMSRYRHADIDVPDYYTYCFEKINLESAKLSSFNKELRGNISNIPPNYQDIMFLKNVKLDYSSFYTENTGLGVFQNKNTFDAAGEIATNAFFFSQSNKSLNEPSTPRQQFVLNNCLNDLMIQTIKTIDILTDFYKSIINDNIDKGIILVIIIILSGVLILGGSVAISTREFRLNMFKLFESLIRLNDVEIEIVQTRIKEFLAYIEKTHIEELDLDEMELNVHVKKSHYPSKKSLEKTKKTYKYENFFWAPLRDAVVILIMILVYASTMIIFYAFGLSFRDQTFLLSKRLGYCINDLANLNIAVTSLYTFIDNNGTGEVLGTNLEETLPTLISKVGNIEQSFLAYSDDGTSIRQDYADILNAPLCSYMPKDKLSFCEMDSKLTNGGLLGLKSFYSLVLNEAKNYYQNSNRTKKAQISTISQDNLKTMERILYFYTRPAYSALRILLQKDLNSYLEEYQDFSLVVGLSFIALYLLIPAVIWLPVILKVVNRYQNLKKMIKPVPVMMMIENKALIILISKLSPKTVGNSTRGFF